MKLSIILLTANPTEKQYAWQESFRSYLAQADEVIVVDGGSEDLITPFPLEDKLKIIKKPDPAIWTWSEHAKNLNLALEKATGDWIIKADIDWVFHELFHKELRNKLGQLDTLVATMQKYTYYPRRRFVQKGQIPMIVNGKYKHLIRFGKDPKTYTDLTYPITWKGEMDEEGVPLGKLITEKDWGKTGLKFWNFDYTFKTLENAKKLFLRSSISHKTYFGETAWGETEEKAFQVFMDNMRGKFCRSLDIIDGNDIPKYIKERVATLTPEEFGYDGWGML